MFVEKRELVAMHAGELDAWERLLASLSAAQITSPLLPDGLAVKDIVAHLGAWQARTVARLEAAAQGHAPRFPQWPVALDEAESPETVDRANAWIFEANGRRSWADVYQEWRQGFRRFLELLRAAPEPDLRPGGTLAWLAEYQPLEGYPGFLDYHHAEHRAKLEAWLRSQAAP
ncbi:MAG: ClbS/DfsB family four-helix bundle protein [Anaerolineales bacterium]|nr:ClbS/DfsB family four-helix bundle protein [Anaerolineales bacterium]